MAIKQMVTGNLPTFIGGALVPPNTPVYVDDDQIDLDTTLTDENGKTLKGKKDIGLHPIGDYTAPVPVAIAAIGPTGPNPTAPQQLPPGVIQTQAGYTNAAGAPLVAEGSEAAIEVEEGGAPATNSRRKKTDDALS